MTPLPKAEVCADVRRLAAVPGGRARSSQVLRRTRRVALLGAPLYLAAMIWLSGLRPLWLDEILQLLDTRQPSASHLIARLPTHHVGSAPLGYLTQQAALRISGYSVRKARLTAAIFGAAAVAATLLLAAELELGNAWIGALLFAAFPLTVRYSTESRPYAEALFLSVLATVLYVRLARRPEWRLAALYALALAAAAYTQPYAASVGVAHVLWSLWCGQRKTAAFGTVAAGLALATFVPWFCASHATWAAATPVATWNLTALLRVPLVLFREFAGAGYWGSGLLLILCALAWAGRRSRAHALLLLLIVVPAIAALTIDASFGYFLASRQFLWILPPIALLASSAWPRHRMLFALLCGVCLWQSARFFATPREDWQSAADALAANAAKGACLVVAPPEHSSLYEFFRPDLHRAACSGTPDPPQKILAISPYATDRQQVAAISALRAQGYIAEEPAFVGGSALLAFRRR